MEMKECIDRIQAKLGNNWQKGHPTEAGFYLLYCWDGNSKKYALGRAYKSGKIESYNYHYISGEIIAYQKITPYVEEEDEDV